MATLGLKPYYAIPDTGVKMMSQLLREHGYFCTNSDKTDYQFREPRTAWDENSSRAHWRHRPPGMPFFSVFNLEITHESQIWTTYAKNFRYRPGMETDTAQTWTGTIPFPAAAKCPF